MNPKHLSESREHYTPPSIIRRARSVMGGIDLDPASSAEANEVVRARRYYTIEANGYEQRWSGRVLLNPPGGLCDADGTPLVFVPDPTKRSKRLTVRTDGLMSTKRQSAARAWWFKLMREVDAGHVSQAVFIAFSIELLQFAQHPNGMGVRRVDPPEIARLPTPLDFEICIPSERLRFFERRDGHLLEGRQPTHANAIVYVGERADRFREAFRDVGRCGKLLGS